MFLSLEGGTTREWSAKVGGTWFAFVVALALALPQPPYVGYLASGAVVGALLIVVGFAAASRSRSVAARLPRERRTLVVLSAAAGVSVGLILLTVVVLLAREEPALRARFAGRLNEPAWRPLALGFESSILEEVTFRLFAMSVVAWVAHRFVARRAALVIALGASALLFGAAHLPAWLAATHGSAALVVPVLTLNGVAGLLFGCVFWRWGLPYAIVCHLFADIVVQGLGPKLLG
jgi:hypothetical protein